MAIVRDFLEEARSYAALGWPLVPVAGIVDGRCTCRKGAACESPGKHPLIANWQAEATCDIVTITRWFAVYFDMNIGVALGKASGICDIEFDCEEGELSAARLLKTPTPTFDSHRSTHRLFRLPQGFTSANGVVKLQGLELRGVGSGSCQSVFPPSRHNSGSTYRWLPGLSPAEVEVAPFPASVLESLEQERRPSLTFTMADSETLENAAGVAEGGRNARLCQLIGGHLAMRGLDAQLVPWALAFGDRCRPPMVPTEVMKAVSYLVQKHSRGESPKESPQAPPSHALSIVSRPYSEIALEELEWLWPQRLARGKLSLLGGRPGAGKTFLACDLLARISRGAPFPDGTPSIGGDVALVTSEDGAGDTILPRLMAAGADLTRVHCIDGLAGANGRPVHLQIDTHIVEIEQWLDSIPDLVLLAIDPITAHCGRANADANAEVRALLAPLMALAQRRRFSILGITHPAKGARKGLDSFLGSVGWIAAARSAFLVLRDPDAPERRLLLECKNNLAASNGLAYAIVDGKLEWERGAIYCDVDTILAKPPSKFDEAKEWLRERLAEGPCPSADIASDAADEGFSRRTIERCRKALGVLSRKGKGGAWEIALPEDKQPTDNTAEANAEAFEQDRQE